MGVIWARRLLEHRALRIVALAETRDRNRLFDRRGHLPPETDSRHFAILTFAWSGGAPWVRLFGFGVARA